MRTKNNNEYIKINCSVLWFFVLPACGFLEYIMHALSTIIIHQRRGHDILILATITN